MLFIVALRHLRTARASAYYSIAPFAGATTAVTLDAPVTWQLGIAGVLMATGVWPHLTERHEHEHTSTNTHTSHRMVPKVETHCRRVPTSNSHPPVTSNTPTAIIVRPPIRWIPT